MAFDLIIRSFTYLSNCVAMRGIQLQCLPPPSRFLNTMKWMCFPVGHYCILSLYQCQRFAEYACKFVSVLPLYPAGLTACFFFNHFCGTLIDISLQCRLISESMTLLSFAQCCFNYSWSLVILHNYKNFFYFCFFKKCALHQIHRSQLNNNTYLNLWKLHIYQLVFVIFLKLFIAI